MKLPADFPTKKEWPSVKDVGYTTRVTHDTDSHESYGSRFYILNRQLTARRFGEVVRGHGNIEAMHWVLDVNFREDD